MEVDGVEFVTKGLGKLPLTVQKKVLRPAIEQGCTPFVKAAKQFAPRRFGIMARSVIRRVKTYASGVTVGVIGARNEVTIVNGQRVNPGKYARLVEGGTKPHSIGERKHPGSQPNKWMLPAYNSGKAASQQIVNNKIRQGIEKFGGK